MKSLIIIFAALLLTKCKSPIHHSDSSASLSIAAAADLKYALDEMIDEYRVMNPEVVVNVTYGSSGNFFAQIQNDAPFDIYFSADIFYPQKLATTDLALDDEVFTYAVGNVVLWVPNESSIDVEELGISALVDDSVKKIAIANPRHAPYGVAAVAALKSLDAYDLAEPKLVYGENIAQTAQFIQSGAADIGIIAVSLAKAPQMKALGRYWEIPLDAYPTMEQGGIILKQTKVPAVAKGFRDHVLGEDGRRLLKRYGFTLPEN